MSIVTIHEGDNRASLQKLIADGVRVHSVVTDPPYGLVSVQKRFGKEGSAAARTDNNDGSFSRLSKGFMSKTWDGTQIERDPEFWKLIYDILLPGGYCFAFSGSRTGHWQAVAMELAGFIIHPMHGWVYHTGFPKAHNASKAIDKKLGYDRKVIGHEKFRDIRNGHGRGQGDGINASSREGGPEYLMHPITEAGSDEAAQWDGWAYGTQAQKPSLEPIFLAQKPFSEKTGPENLLKHGVGAVNIDGCRVPLDGDFKSKANGRPSITGLPDCYNPENANQPDTEGRHPSNLILDGSDEVLSLFGESKGQQGAVRGDEPSGVTKDIYGKFNGRVPAPVRGDTGLAARFYHQFPLDIEPIICNPKAGKKDRAGSKHPTVKPVALMQYLIRHITPPGGVVLDPFAGSGTTAVAAQNEGFDCILMEAEPEYIEFLKKRFNLNDEYDELKELLA